ncbi:sugar ABC transporter substrate-binding protein [Sphingomonas hengshuiensis]|uniref:Sugar ABC transporter substrate-binding protein n=1 Tax=Sphingomonas hengshuiensis TaxID=1609977 RepID=A0A7U5CUU0_9SPHN|nr:sugar ABC transporter substrate-binding protein [Sphingomonas hengshuiensis]AJP74014.1 sugar ABC transporter substrate-binding protein [Sphingomonas hengshuiensis]
MRRRPLFRIAGAGAILAIGAASVATLAVQVRRDAAAPVVAVRADAPRYGLASAGLGYPFAAAVAKGFVDAANRAGAQAVVLDARGDVQKQANDVQDLIVQRVKGLAVMPLDAVVAQGWVKRAGAAGVPIAAVAAQVGDPRARAIDDVYPGLVALATQDEVTAGEAAGRLAATLLPRGRQARIAIIEGAAGFPEVEQRARGFRRALDAAGADYRIVASQPGNWTSDKGEAACQNILSARPDIDLFFNEADDMLIGCARAVRAAGSDARLVGLGGSKLAVASIKAGAVDGTVCFKPEALGALAFEALRARAEGGDPRERRFLTYPLPAVTAASVGQCEGQW